MPSATTFESINAEVDPLLGRLVNDRYKIVEAVGHGGMGRVYRAIQSPLDKVVALKVLGAGHDRDPNFYKRFFLEASVTAKLTHPNTITLFDYGRTDDGIFYIAMEYLSGRTLSAVMQQEGPLAQERVIHISQQICRSLREAHALGIIHRDLKPANVMLMRQQDDHDFVKVLDFGLVKFFSGDTPAEADITNAGTFMGSPHYIAPEQARNQNPDQRCDIYSLGILMYHMLTGRVPFTAQNPVDIILKHLHDPPVPPTQLRPDLNIAPALEAVLLKCIEKDRAQRYQSMDELLMALKIVRAQFGGSSAQMSMPPIAATYIGPRPTAPNAFTSNTPPSLLTPSSPMSALASSTPAGGQPSLPPPPPSDANAPAPTISVAESTSSGPGQVVRSSRAPLAIAVVVALVAVGVALVVGLMPRSQTVVLAGPPVQAAPALAPIPAPQALAPQTPPAAPVVAPAIETAQPPVPTAITGTTMLRLVSTPSGAEVRDVDDRVIGNTPFEIRVPSNKPFQYTLHAEGYKSLLVKQKGVSGDRLEVVSTLKRDPRADTRYDPLLGSKHSVGYKDDPY